VRSQVLRPPYVYRWAVLIAAVVVLCALVLRAFQPDPGVADTAHVARAAPAKTTSAPRPVAPDVLRQVAGGGDNGVANGEKMLRACAKNLPMGTYYAAVFATGMTKNNYRLAITASTAVTCL